MKKNWFSLLSLCAILSMGVCTVACGDDDDGDDAPSGSSKGCNCTYTYEGYSTSQSFTKEQVKASGASSCSAFARWCNQQSGNVGSWSCK